MELGVSVPDAQRRHSSVAGHRSPLHFSPSDDEPRGPIVPPSPAQISFAPLKLVQTRDTVVEGELHFDFEKQNLVDNYHLMGDKSMETAQAKRERKKLLNNYCIKVEIDKFWRLIPDKHVVGGTEMIDKNMYVELYMKKAKAIRTTFTKHEAKELAEVDWNADLQIAYKTKKNRKKTKRGSGARAKQKRDTNAERLDANAFHVAMFEIADHWTDDINATSYANFLRKLFRRITALSNLVVWEWKSACGASPQVWTRLPEVDLLRVEEAYFSQYRQCVVGLKGHEKGVHIVNMHESVMFPRKLFIGSMNTAMPEAKRQKKLYHLRRVVTAETGPSIRVPPKQINDARSSGLRFKRLEEIQSFWGAQNCTEDSGDDVDTDEESQFLVPMSPASKQHNNWTGDRTNLEDTDNDSSESAPRRQTTFSPGSRKFKGRMSEGPFSSAPRSTKRAGTWGFQDNPFETSENFGKGDSKRTLGDRMPSGLSQREAIVGRRDDTRVFTRHDRGKFAPSFNAGPDELGGTTTEALLEDSQEYDEDSSSSDEDITHSRRRRVSGYLAPNHTARALSLATADEEVPGDIVAHLPSMRPSRVGSSAPVTSDDHGVAARVLSLGSIADRVRDNDPGISTEDQKRISRKTNLKLASWLYKGKKTFSVQLGGLRA